jgi:methylenetetrahydrofolate reductase (NADPH)
VEHLGNYERSLKDKDTFSISWELVPGRGAVERAQEVLVATAEQAARGGRVHALTITHNPGGSPALSAEMLGAEINKLGIEPLVHLTCKDYNRNMLEGLLYGLERAQVRNLLVLTGDYPQTGYSGRPKPVFDLDATTLLGLITALNHGLEVPTPKGTTVLHPTHFFAGAAASPFKALESEQMGQYYKLGKKLRAGAQFIVSQLGYDARKIEELLLAVRHLGFGHVPVLGSVFVLPLAAARLMNRNGLPGCVVTNELLAKIEREAAAPDKGKGKRLERAARMYAMMKGMGFAGVHISGPGMKYADLEFILERGEELAPNWREFVPQFYFPQPNGWYFFARDEKTGLNRPEPAERKASRGRVTLAYQTFKLLHHTMFDPRGIFFRPMQAIARWVDGTRLEELYTRLEHLIKGLTNDCLHCGDCAIFDVGYYCPVSQCPKDQRNGPCGGGYEGWCEVYPNERKCVWVRAYCRLQGDGREDTLGEVQIPPVDHTLAQTSSWLNFFLGRDHAAGTLGIETRPRQGRPGAMRP